jgi:hypothetical protein
MSDDRRDYALRQAEGWRKVAVADARGWKSRIAALEVQFAGAVALVENYAGHRDTCNIVSGAPECNCGFDEAYTAFRRGEDRTEAMG